MPELTHGPNPRLPSASTGLEISWTEDRGRCFLATQDLTPGDDHDEDDDDDDIDHAGDVILREEPYAAVLESVFRVNHCAHCLKKTPTPIPCYECATV